MEGSVRDRLSGTNNTNERIGRGENTSFIGLRSKDGLAVVINQVTNGKGFRWLAHCDACGCDWTYDHAYLVNGGDVRCPASSHGTTGDARRTYDANVEQRVREDVVMSPRQRAEQAASAAEVKQFEEENNATN
jgi:hypothetical protein